MYDFHKSIGNWHTNFRYIESKFNWLEIFIEKLLGATSSIPTLLPQHLFLFDEFGVWPGNLYWKNYDCKALCYGGLISLRLDFQRHFLLCISSLEIQSGKCFRKSNVNKINIGFICWSSIALHGLNLVK